MHYKNQPLHFCLLIPCFNDEAGLIISLQSINYPVNNYLVVVVDDGSKTPLSIQKIKEKLPDLPVHLISLEQNSGITHALNEGLRWILQNTTAPYIARLDCNDTCSADRFTLQVQYLNDHPEVGLLGSWCTFKEAGTAISYNYTTPTKHDAIVKAMHLRNVFIHPTVMFRTSVLQKAGLYPDDYNHVEDYALFWAMIKVTRGAVLNRFLVSCAITKTGISLANRNGQLKGRKRVLKDFSENKWLKNWGLIKINMFMILPYSLLLQLKRL